MDDVGNGYFVHKSQDFAQCQENFTRSQNRDTMTFRNSDNKYHIKSVERQTKKMFR